MNLHLITLDQFEEQLPSNGKQINALFDTDTITIYQAYNDKIADFAIEHQYLGGKFQDDRMTWIKPNYLWMMHRSAWATKLNQERILAIRIRRKFFDELLKESVLTSFHQKIYGNLDAWKKAFKESNVQVQWDPAYDLDDQKQDYKAIQIGLQGDMTTRFSKNEILEIIDITNFVHEQYMPAKYRDLELLKLPNEKEYILSSEIAKNIGLS